MNTPEPVIQTDESPEGFKLMYKFPETEKYVELPTALDTMATEISDLRKEVAELKGALLSLTQAYKKHILWH